MLDPKGRDWMPDFPSPKPGPKPGPKPQPLTPEPPLAVYPIRKCLFCEAMTNREACAKCQALKLATLGATITPTLGELRERVRDGRLTDWPDQQWTHTEMQTIWLCGAQKWQAAERILLAIIDRAVSRGFAWHPAHSKLQHQVKQWFFHPEYFGEDKAA